MIEFDAQVLNEAANVAGRTLSNNFGVLYDADGTGDPDPNPTPSTTVDTIVVSPVLTISKGASTAGPVNAGDAITYTLTITNPGGANSSTAFDALVTDTMPADIRVTAITNVALAGGATTDSAVAITGSGAASSATAASATLRSSGEKCGNSPVLPRPRMPLMPAARSNAMCVASAARSRRPAESVGSHWAE